MNVCQIGTGLFIWWVAQGHVAWRCLVGGKPAFERIVSNLRATKIPFSGDVRHNVQVGDKLEMDELESCETLDCVREFVAVMMRAPVRFAPYRGPRLPYAACSPDEPDFVCRSAWVERVSK